MISDRSLEHRIAEIERRLDDMRTSQLQSSRIGAGGLTVADGGTIQLVNDSGDVVAELDKDSQTFFDNAGNPLTVLDGSGLVVGPASLTASGVTVGPTTLDSSGVEVGPTSLGSTGLEVDGGSVVATFTDVKEGTANGITLTSTMTEHVSASFTLPSWVASAKVLATCYVQATNSTGAQRDIRASCRINDVDDGAAQVSLPDNTNGQAVHLDESTIDTSLSGFTVKASGYGQHLGSSPGDDMSANALVWGIIIGYAT